jgi:hypothetical protein
MDQLIDTHKDLHSDQGSRPGERPGRARNPVIKVADIAWLEFEKPAPLTASCLAPEGPPASKDFLGTNPKSARHELVSMIAALRGSNEFDIKRLIGLLKVSTS